MSAATIDELAAARARRRVETLNVAIETSIIAIECPACVAPVFVPSDSAGERVDCLCCDARLVTRMGIDGITLVLIETGGAP